MKSTKLLNGFWQVSLGAFSSSARTKTEATANVIASIEADGRVNKRPMVHVAVSGIVWTLYYDLCWTYIHTGSDCCVMLNCSRDEAYGRMLSHAEQYDA